MTGPGTDDFYMRITGCANAEEYAQKVWRDSLEDGLSRASIIYEFLMIPKAALQLMISILALSCTIGIATMGSLALDSLSVIAYAIAALASIIALLNFSFHAFQPRVIWERETSRPGDSIATKTRLKMLARFKEEALLSTLFQLLPFVLLIHPPKIATWPYLGAILYFLFHAALAVYLGIGTIMRQSRASMRQIEAEVGEKIRGTRLEEGEV